MRSTVVKETAPPDNPITKKQSKESKLIMSADKSSRKLMGPTKKQELWDFLKLVLKEKKLPMCFSERTISTFKSQVFTINFI